MNAKKLQRNNMLFEFLRTLLAIAIALSLVLLLILVFSDEPGKAIHSFLLGPLSSLRRIGNVLELAVPLTFCGIAIAITFRTKQYNLIAEGAFYGGMMVACVIGLYFPGPSYLSVILGLLGGAIFGALMAFIPAFMQVKLGVLVLVSSLMFNYVIEKMVSYTLINVVRDPNQASLQSYPLPEGVSLGKLIPGTRIHGGFVLLAFCVLACYILLYRNKHGYELRMTGSNARFADFSGIPVGLTIIGAQVLGGALAGLGGSVEMLGIYQTFKWTSSPQYGWDGIIIATLAQNNPALVPVAAIFLAYIRIGADVLNVRADIPSEIVSGIQALIILLLASQAFLQKWRQRLLVKQSLGAKNIEKTL